MVIEKGRARRSAAGTIARPDDGEPDDISVSPDIPVSAIPVAGQSPNGAQGFGDRQLPGAARRARLRYLPGLDGLRAISVLAVLAFHWRPDNSLLRGGFLGVEVFFVISGYLITSLLLAERRRQGGVSLTAFWLRRARRLAPALAALILAAGLFILIFHHSELHAIPRRSVCFRVLGRELVVDLPPCAVQRAGLAPAAAAPVVVGGRGAVLPGVAAHVPRGHGRGPRSQAHAHPRLQALQHSASTWFRLDRVVARVVTVGGEPAEHALREHVQPRVSATARLARGIPHASPDRFRGTPAATSVSCARLASTSLGISSRSCCSASRWIYYARR